MGNNITNNTNEDCIPSPPDCNKNPPPPPPPKSIAVDDCASICVTESVCGKSTTVTSSTIATGDLLSNDKNLNSDPSHISKIISSNGTVGSASGDTITVKGLYGTLTVYTIADGASHPAGSYSYVLNNGAIPPKGASDSFTYTLTDQSGCSSTACLKVDLNVTQVQIPMAQACDDSASICVTENVCGKMTTLVSSTSASGNLLANDKGLGQDPSSITSISDAHNAKPVLPDAHGVITIDSGVGTLTVYTEAYNGHKAGDYSYSLDKGVIPPANAAPDVFKYTITDCGGCTSSANLSVCLNVTQVQIPMAQACDDSASICVTENVCGKMTSLVSSTIATGNLLANDKGLGQDPSSISSVSDAKNPAGVAPDAHGVITIDSGVGTLVVYTQDYNGHKAGDYSYSLDKGVIPPANAAPDVFKYTITDCSGCTSSANLSVCLNVTQVQIPMAQACDDSASICVTENVCGKMTSLVSSTIATGNLLANDKGLGQDPSSISSVSDAKNPAGVAPDAHGVITIDSGVGTLVVYTQDYNGHKAGDYSYSLDKGVIPPANAAPDVFKYTITDCSGCTSSANLSVCLNVTQVQIPMAQACDDSASICVTENVCGKMTSLVSSTIATGNLLANDKGLGQDPSSISSVSDAKNPAGVAPDAHGVITIDSGVGTLIVYTQDYNGHKAGDYSYSLDKGVIPPANAAPDVFKYTITDCSGCTSSANLSVCLNVTQVQIPMAQACDDSASICVTENVCGKMTSLLSSTIATGNLLANDKGLGQDPSNITSISDAKNPAGVAPDAHGVITIDSGVGTLIVYTQAYNGHAAGDYSYSLDKGVIPPANAAPDVFKYTITDYSGCTSSANLSVCLNVTQIQIPMAQACDDSASICVTENVCGKMTSLVSSTIATGNLLANDKGLGQDPSNITSISDAHNAKPALPDAHGVITIDSGVGTLTVYTVAYNGHAAGDYSYSLDKGVIPPANAAPDVFNYTLTDAGGCTSSANLSVALNVTQIMIPMAQACDDSGSICVTENVCGKMTSLVSSTIATGNLLANDKGLGQDPSNITSISDAKNPAGVAPDAHGVITIDSGVGTLVVYTQAYNGHAAGDYSYSLDSGVIPPANAAPDVFKYTITDAGGCTSSANLSICLNVTQIMIPMAQACDDSASICVTENVCGKMTSLVSSTIATGNLLANDKGLGQDPSNITSISDAHNAKPALPDAHGVITIDSGVGTLTVYTVAYNGHAAGDYSYSLDKGVIPPANAAPDVFNYTLTDAGGCTSSANLSVALNVTQIMIPMAQACDDSGSICVTENVCGKMTSLVSSTIATGNLLANDKGLGQDPSNITSISDAKNPAGVAPDAHGVITIDSGVGTLVVYTQAYNGHAAGDYSYSLDSGVIPPANAAPDVFKYTITDAGGCTSSANLSICLNVTQIMIPMAQACDDSASICVTENVCGKMASLVSSTIATGNLLANDKGLGQDPSSITSISDAKHPAGVAPDAHGVITIDSGVGTLIVYTQDYSGHKAGDYSYSLDSGVIPPKDAAPDVFNYTLTDSSGCTSNANLSIDLNVTQIQIPMAQAIDDCASICVTENVCGKMTTLVSATSASGNLLANDKGLGQDPSSISSISDAKHPAGVAPDAHGVITIDSGVGTLIVYTQDYSGHKAGDYSYSLDSGVIPPKDAAPDVFNYTLTDCSGCTSNANLSIDLNVTQIQIPMAQACDDTASICVTENVCGKMTTLVSATSASGNLLANDKGLGQDPSSITSISDAKHPAGVAPDAHGVITIDSGVGTLIVYTQDYSGHKAGDYSYSLDSGVIPPKDAAPDVFNYTLTDCSGCTSNANLSIDLNVTQIQIPMAQAIDDCASICVTENVCGKMTTLVSATSASGNLLANDKGLGQDPSSISSISDAKHPAGVAPDAHGVITIDSGVGTLIVYTQDYSGHKAGDYSYSLDSGVIPPKDAAPDVFNYTLTDCSGCTSNANLSIDLNVTQIQIPMAQAVDDTASICVTENVCGKMTTLVSATSASGNLLANDKGLGQDPSSISSISDAKHPAGVAPDAHGVITIDSGVGTLIVYTQDYSGHKAGDYSYSLDSGVIPPKNAAPDVFKYTITDCNGCSSSANLSICLNVTQIQIPMAQAVDDCASICVTENVCGTLTSVVSATLASGNLLANDKGLGQDPSSIISISDAKNPGGVAADAHGVITINSGIGTLIVYTQDYSGHKAGDYSYSLDQGVIPPKAGESDAFSYTIQDKSGCTTCANLTIDIAVKQDILKPPVCDEKPKCDDKGNHHDKGKDHHHKQPASCNDSREHDGKHQHNHKDHDNRHENNDNNCSKQSDCDKNAHEIKGNVHDGDDSHDARNCQITSFSCRDHHNNFVECKAGQSLNTQHGQLCINKNGDFSFKQHDAGKSFHEHIEYNKCGSDGHHEKCEISLHTNDMGPQDHHQQGSGCDYIVDACDVQPKFAIGLHDLGLHHPQFESISNNDCGSKGQDLLNCGLNLGHPANDSSNAHCNALPPSPCISQPCAAIDQHLQNCHQEIHIQK